MNDPKWTEVNLPSEYECNTKCLNECNTKCLNDALFGPSVSFSKYSYWASGKGMVNYKLLFISSQGYCHFV